MNFEEFLEKYIDVFDDTDISELKPETIFRDLDEWSSLHALATINMLDKVFGKKITFEQMKQLKSIEEIYELATS